MRLDLVDWHIFLPSVIFISALYPALGAAVSAACRRLPWELRPQDRRDAVIALMGLAFSAVISPAAFHALFVAAPPDFGRPEAIYQVFPHARFVLWFAASYFGYDLVLSAGVLRDPLYTVHAIFSGGGAILAACSPRSQNYFCWLMCFCEATNIGLHVRALMIRLGFAARCKRAFLCVELSFALSYVAFRFGVMLPRFARHCIMITDELAGRIPGLQTPKSVGEAMADLIMCSLSVLFNAYWLWQIIRKVAVKFGGKRCKTLFALLC